MDSEVAVSMRKISVLLIYKCIQFAQDKPIIILQLFLAFLLTFMFPKLLKLIFSPVMIYTAMFLTLILKAGKQQQLEKEKDDKQKKETTIFNDGICNIKGSGLEVGENDTRPENALTKQKFSDDVDCCKQLLKDIRNIDLLPDREAAFPPKRGSSLKAVEDIEENSVNPPLKRTSRKKSVRFSDKKSVLEFEIDDENLDEMEENLTGRVSTSDSESESENEETNQRSTVYVGDPCFFSDETPAEFSEEYEFGIVQLPDECATFEDDNNLIEIAVPSIGESDMLPGNETTPPAYLSKISGMEADDADDMIEIDLCADVLQGI
eukprot:TRINITY_DN8275_c0_g1_i1.p1 TRINITY_DN8275_c0_g1~~TRINITY_DN8275_c0_g1_i1.p1  ORF type:complete len:331 (-),score=62.73 TRINITY_DN8275_c0_g1_i1:103-1065(-)